LIKPLDGGMSFRVHTPEGISGFRKYRDAERYALDTASRIAGEKARAAGADKIEMDLKKKSLGIPNANFNENPGMLIQTEIFATAIGRPRIK
jgi:ribosomal protein S11